MAIFLGQWGDSYAECLSEKYGDLSGSEALYLPFCLKKFKGGEYKVRLVDEHCGKEPEKCDLSCRNPSELAERIADDDVFVVVRGKSGYDWNSDLNLGIAFQAAHVLKSGDREYFGGARAKRLVLVMPHESYTKQDHVFTKKYTDNADGDEAEREVLLLGEPITVRMYREMLRKAGYDLMFSVYPHDYRREGWVWKVSRKGEEHRYLTDWRNEDPETLVTLEDWRNFIWAVDPTGVFSPYIKKNEIKVDYITGPDASSGSLVKSVARGLGIWDTDTIEKERSRENASKIKTKKGFDPREIGGKSVAIFDDWVLGGGTMVNGITEADRCGASDINVFIVHGELVGDAYERLTSVELKNARSLKIHATDTVDNPAAFIPTAEKVAQDMHYRIRRIHLND